MKLLKLSLIILLSIQFTNCNQLYKGKSKTGDKKNKSEYVHKMTYKIKLPDYMSKMDLENEDASLQYGNIYKETYVMVIDEDKAEFINLAKSMGLYDENKSPLDNYMEIQTNMFKETLEDEQIEKRPWVFDAGGKTGKIIEISGEIDNIPVYYVIGFVDGNKKLYMIVTWTLKSRANKYKSQLRDIIESFRETVIKTETDILVSI